MGSGVPLLNEYKQEFFWKRVPQTALGGPKLKLGYDAPAYVYINQVVLFLLPWAIGGIFTALVELESMEYDTGIYIYGGIMCVYVILANFISDMRKSKDGTNTTVNTNAKNMLAEDDEVDFQSCCGAETVAFVIPGKKYKINIVVHALLSGPLCGLGFWYLLPMTLSDLYGNVAATVVVHGFGWFTLTIAQYSLTVGAPPETANFRALDTWEITPLMRPFYCLLFFSFHLLAREYSEFELVNEILHGVFPLLPIFWLLGMLPPLTALLIWLGEQGLIILFGGSPMASDLRLLVMIVMSTTVFLAVYFIPHGLVTVALMSLFGYLLSLDLGGFGNQLLSMCCSPRDKHQVDEINTGFLWKWGIFEFLYHVATLGIAVAVALLVNKFVTSEDAELAKDLSDYLAYVIMALLAIEVILSEVQSVYVLFGLWRNKLYPSSVQRTTIFKKGKRRLNVVGFIRRGIMNWVSPLLMVVYLSSSLKFDGNSVDYSADKILGLNRAYRWVWQSTQNSMLEISAVKIISLVTSDDSRWNKYGLGVQLLVVGLARDRLAQILNKLYFYMILLIWSWKDKKQRRTNSCLLITCNIILFPLSLAVIVATAVVAAPLMPLFTLPVFLIGFPRPHRFWSAEVGASANVCEDTVYYKHMAPQLAKAFRDGFAFGSLGEPSPGCHYLVRFQDRMAWIMVLERGYAYCTINIKGLELQETSCHTIEAGRIEDIFEVTFEKENGVPCCSFHPYPFDTLRPYDAATIKTYSDAKNVLTGVIDSPEALQKVADGFIQCLVWVVLHHIYKRSKENFRDYDARDKSDNSNSRSQSAKSLKPTANDRPASVKAWKRLSTHGSTPSMEEHSANKGGTFEEWESQIDFGDTQNDKNSKKYNGGPVRPGTADSSKFQKRPQSAKSFSDSIWSDDSIMFESMDAKNTQKVNLVSGMASHQVNKSNKPTESLAPVENILDEIPGLLSGDENEPSSDKKKNSKKKNKKSKQSHGDSMDDLSLFGDGDFGLPATDIHQKPPARLPPLFDNSTGGGLKNLHSNDNFTEVTTLEAAVQFSSLYSRALCPPITWRQIPISPSTLEKYSQNFPVEWYKHVLRCLKLTVEGDNPVDVTEEVVADKVLESVYAKVVMACNAVVNIMGLGGVDLLQLGTSHVYKMYTGDIPWSMSSGWVTDNKELLHVVTKAYRYSVKLAIEQVLMGDVSSNEELQEYMEEYDRDWYIGSEKDPEWGHSVVQGKPTLFSLGHNTVDGTYSSRTLTKQDMSVYIGSLNAEVVRGQWANLALELLYMTNDDEERYSIQAHPTVLRNLTVQVADPPLGYPIYSSQPLSVPTL